jgi:uncharacterized membrane protein
MLKLHFIACEIADLLEPFGILLGSRILTSFKEMILMCGYVMAFAALLCFCLWQVFGGFGGPETLFVWIVIGFLFLLSSYE